MKTIKLVTGIFGNEPKQYEVELSCLSQEVSRAGNPMYKFKLDIFLGEEENTRFVDRRIVYKAGEFNMSEVRDALVDHIAARLAKDGSAVPFITEEDLLKYTKTPVQLFADIYKDCNGQLQVKLLY